MDKTLLVRKIVEDIAKEFKLKSSNMHSSDADWYIGFGDDVNTANESSFDPKTGKIIHNTSVADKVSYLQQWDADNVGYVEEEDERRDRGIGYQMNAMDQITPIK
jgi:hypothetical protein